MGWSRGHKETTGQKSAEENGCKGKTSTGRAPGEQPNEQRDDPGGNYQDDWLKRPLKQEMIRTLLSLCKTAGKGGICSLKGGSDGKLGEA